MAKRATPLLRNRIFAVALLAAVGIGSMILPALAWAEIEETSLFGAGVRSRPAYDGSASQVRDYVPVIRYFGTPWFLRTTQDVLEGGVRSDIARGLHVGLQLAYEPGRQTSESQFLIAHRVPNVDYGISAGGFAEWDSSIGPAPTSLLARVRQDTRWSHGAQADLRANAGVFASGPVEAAVFAQTSWASSKSNALLYGIGPEESAATGLPAFEAGSGWSIASAGVLASVDLASHWVFVGTGERHWLHGPVAQSPLVQRDGGYYASVGLAYRF